MARRWHDQAATNLVMTDLLRPCESDAAYYARRSADEHVAARSARTLRARCLHGVLAETYRELGVMLEGQARLDESERLLVGLAIAGGLATWSSDPALRDAHRRVVERYRLRLGWRADLPSNASARHDGQCRVP